MSLVSLFRKFNVGYSDLYTLSNLEVRVKFIYFHFYVSLATLVLRRTNKSIVS
jgi:hypothetical protein